MRGPSHHYEKYAGSRVGGEKTLNISEECLMLEITACGAYRWFLYRVLFLLPQKCCHSPGNFCEDYNRAASVVTKIWFLKLQHAHFGADILLICMNTGKKSEAWGLPSAVNESLGDRQPTATGTL